MNKRTLALFLFIVIFSSIGAIFVHRMLFKPIPPDSESLIPHPIKVLNDLPDFTLLDLNGKPQSISQWRGKILILNFWATWCPPCREEIPEFMRLQNELGINGLQFVGVAIDEIKDVTQFATSIGINYPMLIGNDNALQLSEQLGNRLQGLPFSVIFNREGHVVYKGVGSLSTTTIHTNIDSLL